MPHSNLAHRLASQPLPRTAPSLSPKEVQSTWPRAPYPARRCSSLAARERVGNAAIQLARWAGARVITTVSGPAKAMLASAAGADHVVNYRTGNAIEQVRAIAPEGVDIFVEVAPDANTLLDHAVAAPNATIAFYADDAADDVRIPIREAMTKNLRWQGVLVYTVSEHAKDNAIAGVRAAVEDEALQVGENAGVPLHLFALEDTAEAHAAVENGVVGKVLIDVAPNARSGHNRV